MPQSKYSEQLLEKFGALKPPPPLTVSGTALSKIKQAAKIKMNVFNFFTRTPEKVNFIRKLAVEKAFPSILVVKVISLLMKVSKNIKT